MNRAFLAGYKTQFGVYQNPKELYCQVLTQTRTLSKQLETKEKEESILKIGYECKKSNLTK